MTIRCQRCGCAVKLVMRQPTGVQGYWCSANHGRDMFKLCAPCMVTCYPGAFRA